MYGMAHIALSRSGGTHQPVTVISNIVVDIGNAIYAITISVAKRFAAFLISSATKAIAKQIYCQWVRWSRKVGKGLTPSESRVL